MTSKNAYEAFCALWLSALLFSTGATAQLPADAARDAWRGDLPGIAERRLLRVLTVYGPGRYYLDDGPQGLTVEYARALETFINKRFDTGDLRIHVVCIPVARDELFPELERAAEI